MTISGDNCDLIELKSEPARLDKNNIYEYFVIYAWVSGRQMCTDIYLHITQLKMLKKYEGFSTTPIVMLNEPMSFFEENGFIRVQKLTAIWEITEVKV